MLLMGSHQLFLWPFSIAMFVYQRVLEHSFEHPLNPHGFVSFCCDISYFGCPVISNYDIDMLHD